jgi:hypothetical protein
LRLIRLLGLKLLHGLFLVDFLEYFLADLLVVTQSSCDAFNGVLNRRLLGYVFIAS